MTEIFFENNLFDVYFESKTLGIYLPTSYDAHV